GRSEGCGRHACERRTRAGRRCVISRRRLDPDRRKARGSGRGPACSSRARATNRRSFRHLAACFAACETRAAAVLALSCVAPFLRFSESITSLGEKSWAPVPAWADRGPDLLGLFPSVVYPAPPLCSRALAKTQPAPGRRRRSHRMLG